jgi:hypothetical protein
VLGAPIWGEFYQNMIDEKIYSPGKFEFIEKLVEEDRLVYRNIDIRTGKFVRAPKEYRRKILMKKEQAPKTITDKIWEGFKGLFN